MMMMMMIIIIIIIITFLSYSVKKKIKFGVVLCGNKIAYLM